MSFNSWYFKYNCNKSDKKRDAGLITPEDIERFDNIRYGSIDKWQALDVYRPRNHKGILPVIVSAHGGGWVYGDKDVYQYYCMSLAQRGFVVINYNYRLAPRYKFPAAIEDTNLVFGWVMNNIDKYGMDSDNIFMLGDSAGGAITGIYASILTNEEYAKKFGFKVPEGLALKAVGLNCGDYNLLREDCAIFVRDIFPNKGSKEELELMSAACHITEKFPPSFVFTASHDFLREEAVNLIEILKEKKNLYEFRIYGSEENPLYHVFHCNVRSGEAAIANEEECNFFKQYIALRDRV